MTEVSIIIPSYNHAAYIGHAIESVLNQTWSDFELIVVDDGSTDRSLDTIRKYSDPRLHVHIQENCGAHAAINRGIELAQGRYIAILNSDDAYTPDRLEKIIPILKTEPTFCLAGSYIQVIDSSGVKLGIKHSYNDLEPWPLAHAELSFRAGEDLFAALLTENHLATTSNFIFERSLHTRLGGFRPLRYTHDWDFALRVAQAAGGKICIVPDPLLEYRIHPRNTINENTAAMIFEICWCLAVHLPGSLQWLQPPFRSGNGQATRLLHSIYTYHADAVLCVLLAMDLAHDESLALDLLSPQHAVRNECLDYIRIVMADQQVPLNSPLSATLPRRIRNFLRRLTTYINKK